jgi:homocysteine S-methyltransferase
MSIPTAPPAPARSGLSFREAIERGPLTLDGAMGTELYARGVPFTVNYEELCVPRPELILRVHEDYVAAGAQMIETNSFGANRIRLARSGFEHRVNELNAAAVALARRAAGEGVYVAGSIGPTGLSLNELHEGERGRVREAFEEQATALAAAGVDALFLETLRSATELELAMEGLVRAVGRSIPIVAHVSVDAELTLAGDLPIASAGARMKELGADVIGINCTEGPEIVFAAAMELASIGLPVSVIPNAGLPRRVRDGDEHDGSEPTPGAPADRFIYPATPEDFGVLARKLCKLGVRLIGGCCGTTPAHVRSIAETVHRARSATGAASSPSRSR